MLIKREDGGGHQNWAQQESGVIAVFVIVGLVAIGLIGFWIQKKVAARKNRVATKSAAGI